MKRLILILALAGCVPAADLSDCANMCIEDIPMGVPTPTHIGTVICEPIRQSSLRYECRKL